MRMMFAAICTVLLAGPAFADDIQVTGAYARPTTASAQTAAVYMTLANSGATDDRLVAVETAVAAEATLHSSAVNAEGMMQMLEIEGGVAIATGAEHAFAPGGDHVMLMGLTQPLTEGAQFTVTLTFEVAGKMVVVVPVQKGAADMDHSGHGEHDGHGTAPAND
jgi:periplasmic copper chaperone A